jgi:hypothetical protein
MPTLPDTIGICDFCWGTREHWVPVWVGIDGDTEWGEEPCPECAHANDTETEASHANPSP